MGYNPGSISINSLIVNSPIKGSWNATENLLSASILETIFTPGISAQFDIIDSDNWIGTMQLQGVETVTFSFSKLPDGGTLDYTFHLNNVKFIKIEGSAKSKRYTMNCISKEAFDGRIVNVQKAYKAPISAIVGDVFGELPGAGAIAVESTKGQRNLKITSQPVYDAIEMLRKEAVSQQYETSNYMFWQTWQSFHFKTLEYMVNQPPVKILKQDFTIGTSINKSVDDNIITWKVLQNFDAMNRAKAGVVNQRVAVFDPNTLSYRISNYQADPITEMGNMAYDVFRSIFGGPDRGRVVMSYRNPSQTLGIPKTNVPASIPYKQLNLAQMQEQLLRMTLIGDPVLQAGSIVFCNVPRITSVSDEIGYQEQQLNGRWLLAKVEHEIRVATSAPRYICNVECLKGGYSGAMTL